jgi:hypothetical protein
MAVRRVCAIGILGVALLAGCRSEIYKPCQERPQDVRIRMETSRSPFLICGQYPSPPILYITQPDGTTWEVRVPTNRPRDWGLWRYDAGSRDPVPVDFRVSDEPPRSLAGLAPVTQPSSKQPVASGLQDPPMDDTAR